LLIVPASKTKRC